MNEFDTAPDAVGVPVTPIDPPAVETAPEPDLEPVVTPRRRRPSPKTVEMTTLRNRRRRVVVVSDKNGNGIHLFPGVDVEVPTEIIGDDVHQKAKSGLITLV